jgi:hypothetical protein
MLMHMETVIRVGVGIHTVLAGPVSTQYGQCCSSSSVRTDATADSAPFQAGLNSRLHHNPLSDHVRHLLQNL